MRIYSGTSATYNGKDFVVKDVFQPGTLQVSGYGPSGIGSINYDSSSATYDISAELGRRLFGYVYIEGDFTATVKVLSYTKHLGLPESQSAGFALPKNLLYLRTSRFWPRIIFMAVCNTLLMFGQIIL